MKASVIIPTCNRAAQLERTLQSVLTIDFDPQQYEVIVVDNGSTDRTPQIIEEAAQRHPSRNLRSVYDAVPGLLTGRHRGAAEAKSDILVFVDDDIAASPNWLSAIVGAFTRYPHIALVGGKCLPNYEKEPPAWVTSFWKEAPGGGRYMGELSLCDLGDIPKEIDPMFVWGLNFSIRKQSLYELGGFHPDNIAPQFQHFQGDGETGISLAMKARGMKAFYHPEALVYHEVPADRMTVGYFDRRYFYQGVCNSYSMLRRSAAGSETVPNSSENVIRSAVRAVRKAFSPSEPPVIAPPVSPEVDMLLKRFQAMEEAGFRFHQEVASAVPAVMEWVTKKDYFDYQLPVISVAKR